MMRTASIARRAALASALLCAGMPPLRAQFVPPSDLDEQQAIESHIDTAVDSAMAEFDVPGTVVTVVKDGRILLCKGYGFADLDTRRRVIAGETVFRVGSVSKPVTATAVMQLVGQGRLDLHADVNRYLKGFQIDRRFPQPVTAADLLTHTAGFDVRLNGTAAETDGAILPLETYLARDMPPRVRPPGEVLAYSNHGYTLLGRLVEVISGRPFEVYMDESVLRPLGMRQSGFRLTGELARRAAAGYEPHPEGPLRSAPIHPNILPAAGLNTTAADMAQFMIAHLGDGGGGLGLSAALLQEMHDGHFVLDEAMPRMTYGFFEGRENGQRLLMHGGGLRGFMSGVYLWPQKHLGLFVSNNGYSVDLIWRVFYAFEDQYFPVSRPAAAPRPGARERGVRYTGIYRLVNHPRLNLERSGALRGGDLEVTVDRDGGLSAFGLRFIEISDGHYAGEKRDTPLVFHEDDHGRVRYMMTSDPFYGLETWERLPWYDNGGVQSALLVLLVAVFLSAPLFNPAASRVNVLFEPIGPVERPPRNARRIALFVCALDLLFLVGMVVSFRMTSASGLLYGVPALMRLTLLVPFAAILPTALMLGRCVAAWKHRDWRPVTRLHYSILTVASVGYLLFLNYWNLIGFRF